MSPRLSFVLGGVQKGGTTALASFIAQHPRIRLPRLKEAHVFDDPDFDETWGPLEIDGRYAGHFDEDQAGMDLVYGDATPIYCFHPRLVARIARYNPAMRWILILRHPVDRAVSQWRMETARGYEDWPLWRAALFERWRVVGHEDDFSPVSPLRRHAYLARGDYARQLDVLYARFPRRQVLLLRNEELAVAPAGVLSKVWEFLELPVPTHRPVTGRVFDGGRPPLHAAAPVRGLLALLLRRRMRDATLRYGIRW